LEFYSDIVQWCWWWCMWLQLMTSVASDNQVDAHVQQSYLNDRCAYLTEQLAKHRAQVNVRTRSVSVSEDEKMKQKQTGVSSRQRHASASAQVTFLLCHYRQCHHQVFSLDSSGVNPNLFLLGWGRNFIWRQIDIDSLTLLQRLSMFEQIAVIEMVGINIHEVANCNKWHYCGCSCPAANATVSCGNSCVYNRAIYSLCC